MALHKYGGCAWKGLEKHAKDNTSPIHASTGKFGGNGVKSIREVRPLLKDFFVNTILPLATPVANTSIAAVVGDDTSPMIFELDSRYSQRGFFAEFAWKYGWKVAQAANGNVKCTPREDTEWVGNGDGIDEHNTNTRKNIGSRTAFANYWGKHYPNVKVASAEDSARAEELHARGIKTGPWSSEEHDSFVKGYQQYGRNWKKISETHVKTRTNLQIQNHGRNFKMKCIRSEKRDTK